MREIKIHNFEQGTDEWFAVRRGKFTASHAQAIGNVGKGLETYAKSVAAEFFSSKPKEQFSNAHTERGNELEPQAREIYSLKNMVEIDQVGFCELNEYIGCSPDGFVGEEGGIEIKSQDDEKHFSLVLHGAKEIDSKYVWQIQMNLWITGRKWWDFISYNPNYKKSLFVHRFFPDDEKFKKLEEGCLEGVRLFKEFKKVYESQLDQ